MRFVWVVLSAIILSLFAVQPTHAQTFDWVCNFNFATGTQGWIRYNNLEGVHTSGIGWEDTYNATFGTRGIWVALTLPASANLREAGAVFDRTAGAGNTAISHGIQISGAPAIPTAVTPTPNGTNQNYVWTGNINSSFIMILARVSARTPVADGGGSSTLKSAYIAGTGTMPALSQCALTVPTLTRPISTANSYGWGRVGSVAYGNTPGLPVHAARQGIVSTLRRAKWSDCIAMGITNCSIMLPSPVDIPVLGGQTFQEYTATFDAPGFPWDDNIIDSAWYVVITSTSPPGTYRYIVASADLYLQSGQTVSAGCVLGNTLRARTTVNVADGYNPSYYHEFGVALVDNLDYTVNPSSTTPCNNAPELRGCLGDNLLSDSGQWEAYGGAIFSAPGFALPPDAGITTVMNLDPARNPRLSVIAQRRDEQYQIGPSLLILTLGTTDIQAEITANPYTWQTVSIPANPHAPDLAGLYTIGVKNASSVVMDIYSVCVQLGSDTTPPMPPGGGGGGNPPVEPPPAGVGETVNEAGCIRVPFPAGESVASWTSWLWARLNRFFQCDLMLILRQVRAEIASFARTVSLSIRWNMALAQRALDWIGTSLIPYFAGYLANIQPATVEIEGCNNFWCALASIIGNIITGVIAPILDLINTILNFATDILGNLINAFIDLIFSFINTALTLFNIARLAFLALLNAWLNSTPTMPPGFATCPTIPDSSNPLCLLFWVLENTVFTQSGALIIPVMTGWFSIHLVLYFISEIKRTVIQLGQAT